MLPFCKRFERCFRRHTRNRHDGRIALERPPELQFALLLAPALRFARLAV